MPAPPPAQGAGTAEPARRQEEERLETRDKQRRDEDAKIAPLRALRLAKEAANKPTRRPSHRPAQASAGAG